MIALVVGAIEEWGQQVVAQQWSTAEANSEETVVHSCRGNVPRHAGACTVLIFDGIWFHHEGSVQIIA